MTFCGTVRNHSDGGSDVISLDYQSFDEEVERRLGGVAASARVRWPTIGRVVLLHRLGTLEVGEVSVVVVVSSPHRDEAFEAARLCVDTLKGSIPIWERDTWAGGDWSVCPHAIEPVDQDGVEDHNNRLALAEKRPG